MQIRNIKNRLKKGIIYACSAVVIGSCSYIYFKDGPLEKYEKTSISYIVWNEENKENTLYLKLQKNVACRSHSSASTCWNGMIKLGDRKEYLDFDYEKASLSDFAEGVSSWAKDNDIGIDTLVIEKEYPILGNIYNYSQTPMKPAQAGDLSDSDISIIMDKIGAQKYCILE